MKRIAVLLSVVCLFAWVLPACSQSKVVHQKTGDVEYDLVQPNYLKDKALKQWYEESLQKGEVSTVSYVDGYKYIFITSPEAPQGNGLVITRALQESGLLILYIKTEPLEKKEPPHLLLRIAEQGELNVRVELEGESTEKEAGSADMLTGVEGTIIGQVDSNFVEIELDPEVSFPGDSKTIVFKLSEEVRAYFEPGKGQEGFSSQDRVKLDCVKTKQGHWEIQKLTKLAEQK